MRSCGDGAGSSSVVVIELRDALLVDTCGRFIAVYNDTLFERELLSLDITQEILNDSQPVKNCT